ncbi:MAG: hypothetical protein HQ534_07910 [Armatimonadetes bacterium]|nr:hypothetical protein [Armatimonadota bacterium]
MKKLLIVLIFFPILLFSQSNYRDSNTSKELITIPRETSFLEAVNILGIMSEQYAGKKVINLSDHTGSIGLPVNQLYWLDALNLIVNFNELIIEELPGVFLIKTFVEEEEIEIDEIKITPDTKQVKISSVFFKADKSLLNSIGIDWSTLYNGEVQASFGFQGASQVSGGLFNSAITTTYEAGAVSIDVNTLFKIIEANQLGTIIAKPTITVLSGKNGFIQVGEDFSVKTVDDAGNITDEFFSTGIILDVTPVILQDEEKEVIYLVSSVEKSSATPGAISTVINKSSSNTEVILYDGEETVIGGIYTIDEVKARTGIPILKDLPWWFFGIRYLTGYNRFEKNVREMIIILKAEIVQPVEQRKFEKIPGKETIKDLRDSNSKVEELFKTYEENIEEE